MEGGRKPRMLGQYRLLEVLGEGGMGVVYRAEHAGTLQDVALKTVRVPTQEMLWCIRHEIDALSRVQHPGVMRIFDHGVEAGVPWYAMELFKGMTLHSYFDAIWPGRGDDLPPPSWIDRIGSTNVLPRDPGGRGEDTRSLEGAQVEMALAAGEPNYLKTPRVLPPRARPRAAGGQLPSALTLIRHLCATLAYLHGQGLVHLDLKPRNIFIRPDWTPVIFDLTLGSHGNMVGREALAWRGGVAGTLAYMSPEHFRGDILDARTDLYSLGCILYECVTGHLPFYGHDIESLSQAHREASPVPPSLLASGVPAELDDLILRLLAKRPADRVGHASHVARELCKLGATRSGWASEYPAADYLYRPDFVGRTGALEWLKTHLEPLRSGSGRCIFVGGESGQGKTRLMIEFARECEKGGKRIVTGQCLPAGTKDRESVSPPSPPLRAFRPVLQAIADHCMEMGREETDSVLGERGKILARYEPALAGLPGQAAYREPASISSEEGHYRILHSLGITLGRFAAVRPLVIILDDIQWADELTLGFCRLFHEGAFGRMPLLLACTFRIDEAGPLLRKILDASGNDRVLELGPLDDGEVGQIVAGMLGMSAPPEPLARLLSRRSSGNPFFVAEYLRLAVSESILRRGELGQWVLVDSSEGVFDAIQRIVPLPRTLHALVMRRLGGLPPDSLRVLELAATLGLEFDAPLLESSGVADGPTVLAAVSDLVRRQILEQQEAGRLRFVHETLQKATYERLTDARRRELHEAAAVAIETQYARSAQRRHYHAALAGHWDLARDPHKALWYLEKAGDTALESGAYEQAHGYFKRALALAAELRDQPDGRPDPRRLARWMRCAGECCLGLGKLPESRKCFEDALSHLGCSFPQTRWKLARSLLWQIALQTMHRTFPSVFVRPAPSRGEMLREASRLYHRLLIARSFDHELEPLLYAAVRSANLTESAGMREELSRAYASLHAVLGMVPYHVPLSENYAKKGYGAVSEDDRIGLLWVLLADAGYRVGKCEWERCLTTVERGKEAAAKLGGIRHLEDFSGILSTYHFLRGAFAEALAHARAEHESALRGDNQSQCLGLLRICESQIVLGRADEALATLRAAQPLISSGLGRLVELWHMALTATVWLMKEDWDKARICASEALELLLHGSPVFWQCLFAYTCIASVHVSLHERAVDFGKAGPYREARRACLCLFRSARVLPAAGPAATRLWGRYLWSRGRPSRAIALWEKSVAQARRIGMPREEALALLELGRHLPPEASRRVQATLRAKEILESLGLEVPALDGRRVQVG